MVLCVVLLFLCSGSLFEVIALCVLVLVLYLDSGSLFEVLVLYLGYGSLLWFFI